MTQPLRTTLPRLAAVVIAVAGVGLASCDDLGGDPKRQIGANPFLPAVHQYLVPPIRIARPAPWGNETPKVPQGLQVQALATGLQHPRSLYVLPNGDVLVVESNGPKAPVFRPKDLVTGWVQWFAGAKAKDANRITLLRHKGDGTPDLRAVFLDNLNSPFGVALVGHDLYVANTDAIVRYPYEDGQTSIAAPGTKLTDLPGGPIDHHWTKALLASPDGSKLYVGVGSNSNVAENGIQAEYERAAIWEVDRATGAHRIYASGVRNPTGLQWEPENGKLWAIANERDEIGPDLVPDYLTSVKDGGFYGWPYSYYGQHLDPRVEPQRPDLVAKAIVPDYALSSHVAPLGLAMATGNSLPGYGAGAFVGEHGSWNRVPRNGYKVVFVPFSGGKPSGMAQDVVNGFLDANNDAHGRPVGLAIDRTGALLIADDIGNTVWRVSSAVPATQLKPAS
jgi:glucose/arabinose dehydrogenase